MAITLYEATAAGFIQTVGAVDGFLGKGLAWCREQGIDPAEIVEARIHPDMQPFHFQVVSVVRHSKNAIEALQTGAFKPGPAPEQPTYEGLQGMVAEALAWLKALKPDDVNSLEARDVTFQMREGAPSFTGPGFLFSFSIPNLHFHATTAYDILRGRGAPVGKRDYMGQLRLKT